MQCIIMEKHSNQINTPCRSLYPEYISVVEVILGLNSSGCVVVFEVVIQWNIQFSDYAVVLTLFKYERLSSGISNCFAVVLSK